MSRRDERELLIKLLYEYTYHDGNNPSDFIADREKFNETEYPDFVRESFVGVISAQSEIDKAIGELSNGWKISRISKITISILRLAAYEIIFTDTPAKAVINEALEISKIYDEPKSTSFINGILNNLARKENKITDEKSDKE